MARINVDDSAHRDPRMKRLGKLLAPRIAASLQHALGLGAMVRLWDYCTERQVYSLSKATLEDLTDVPDMAGHLVVAELADPTDDGGYYIKGTRGRIEWLERLRSNASLGGEAHRRKLQGKIKPTGSQQGSHLASQTGARPEPGGEPDRSPLSLALSPALVIPPVVPQGTLPGLPVKEPDLEPPEVAVAARVIRFLNRIAGRSFEADSDVTIAHVRARLGEGRTLRDLLAVTWHRACDWRDDDRMRKYLRPETLFGHATKFPGYLADARDAFPGGLAAYECATPADVEALPLSASPSSAPPPPTNGEKPRRPPTVAELRAEMKRNGGSTV